LADEVHMVRLGIALLSFVNATAAVAVPRVLAHGGDRVLPSIEVAGPRGLQVRVQRPPRVPRREPFVTAPSDVAAGSVE
jgi:hypothetical protein